MSFNTFGHMFRVTTFGESHGVAIGCVVDGCPPRTPLEPAEIQVDLDRAGHETEILTKGRHDPCVGIRAVPVGEAMMACVLADHLLRHRGQVG